MSSITTIFPGYSISQNGKDITLTPPSGKHTHTLIWLHTFKGESQDFFKQFPEGSAMFPQNLRIVLPNAICQPVTAIGGESVNSWFDFKAFTPSDESIYDSETLNKCYQRISNVIENEKKLVNNDISKIFLGGLTQGCFMALYIAFTYPGKNLGGVIGLHGFLTNKATINHCKERKQMAVLLFHGLEDKAIPPNFAFSTYEKIFQNCLNSKLIKANGIGHGIVNAEAVMGVKEFLFKYAK